MSITAFLAYVDPGSLGLILYSTALSLGIGVLFFFRTLKQKVVAVFRGRPAPSADSDDE